jgi:hypothetical protein
VLDLLLFRLDRGSKAFFRKIGILLSDYTASRSRIQYSFSCVQLRRRAVQSHYYAAALQAASRSMAISVN